MPRTSAAFRRLLPFAILVAVVRCGGDNGVTSPGEGRPAAIDKLWGDNQTGVVGKPLADSLLVRITDSKDRPVQGQKVAFVFTAGGSGALLIPDTALTDADGRAWSQWGLGSLAGQQRVEARVVGSTSGLKATFTATAGADVADAITAVKGTGQTGVVGGLLADSLAVLITDRFGNPIAGRAVTWSIPAGQGSISASNTVTGADGRAAVTRTLGPTAGTQTTTATATGVPGSPVTFTHTATANTAVRIVKLWGDNGTAPVGSRLTDSLVVQVQDAASNGVPGRNVNWVVTGGGGTAQPLTSVTDASGKAFTVWTLGPTAGANSVTAAVAGLPQVTFNATAIAAQPAQIAAQSATTQAGTAGQNVGAPPSVRVADSNNNPVQGVTVTFQVTAGGGTVANAIGSGLSVTVGTGANGVATLSSWTLGTVAGANTVTATAAGTGITGNPVTFNATGQAGSASKLVFLQGPANTTAGQAIAPGVTVQVQDANGNLVTSATTSVTVALGANPGGGTLGGTKTVAAVGGIATFSTLTVDKAAAGYTLTASATGLSGATSGTFDIAPAAASTLAFVQQPTNAAAGAAITPAVTVAVQDAFGNTVTSSTAQVTLAFGSNPSGATLGGTTSQAAVSGIATFANLTVNKAGSGYTLSAASTGLAGATSGSFSIGSGVATKLAFLQQPTTTPAGAAITPAVTVAIQDANGNTVTSATGQVTITIGNNAAGNATLGGTATVAAVNGVATFSTLTLDKVGSGYTLVASATGLAGATSAAFDVTVGAILKLVFGVQPTNVSAGSLITPAVVVRVEDAGGNLATSFSGSVTMSLGANPGNGALGGTLTRPVSAGLATFTDLWVDRPAAGYTLTAATSGPSPATSAGFDVAPGAAARLRITVEPGTSVAGAAIAPSPVVQVEDTLGNLVTSSTASITASLVANPGLDVLGGTTTVNAAGGLATFPNLALTKAAAGYTIQFAATGLVPDTTVAFTVNAGVPAALLFGTQPSNVSAGATMTPPVTVLVKDSFGNTVTSATTAVTLLLTGGTPGALLTGGGPVNAVNGVATFSGLSVNLAGTGYGLQATGGGLPAASSTSFDVTTGAETKLAFQVQPSNSTAGAAMTPAVVVAVQDAQGNTVTSSNASITVALTTPNGANLGGTTTVSAVNGVASFSNLSVDLVGNYTLTATSGSLTAATSTSFSIGPAAASQLVFTGQPSNTVAGTTIQPPVQVTIRDAFGNTVTGATTTVTIGIGTNPNKGRLSGTTAIAAVAGVATFSTLSIDKSGNGYTLTANGGGLPQAISAPFNIVAGSGNKLAFVSQPTNTTVGTPISPAIQVAVQDAQGNTILASTDSIRLSLFPPGSLGGTVGMRAVNGVATFSNITVANAGTGYTLTAFAPVASPALQSATSTPFDVTASNTSTSITADTPDPSVTGQGYTVSFSVSSAGGTPSGTVIVSDGTDSCQGALAGGAGSCVLTSTTAGAKTLTADYVGNSNFSGSTSAGVSHTVNKASTVLQVTGDAADPSVTGETVTVTWSSFVASPGAGTPTGTVTVGDGSGATCTAPIAAGSCSLALPLVGNRTLAATYAGDANFNGSSDTDAHTVNKAVTTTLIGVVSPSPASFGQLVTVNYGVSVTAPGAGTPTGTVTLSDGAAGCSATVAAGSCSYTPSSAGAKTLSATYAGDANYSGSLVSGTGLTVNPAATATAITAHTPDPVGLGSPIAVTVAVTTTTGATPAGSVLVSDDLGASCSIPTLSGSGGTATGSCNLTPTAAGSRTLTAAYTPGSGNFTSSTSSGVSSAVSAAASTTTITADTPDPSVTGEPVAVSVTVAGSGGTPTGSVTVSASTGESCPVTLAAGAGSCNLSFATPGARTITASYGGDANFGGSISAATGHTVNPAATTTTITGDTPDPSVTGQAYSVSFSVAVTSPGAGTPTGNVTVSDGTDQCVGTVAAGSCSLTSTTAGSKTLVATYAGDANFSTSLSAGAAHTVSQAATTTAITNDTPDPSTVGQAYTVSFTVVPNAPGAGAPTGNVTVSDGTGASCIGTVAAGSCSLASTSAGSKTLTATYAGDADFAGSTSAGAGHTVSAAGTATTITGDTPDPSAVGQVYTVSFNVTSSGGTPTGNVTVSDGTDQCVGTVAAGSCSLTSTTSGAKTLVATYAGDANFAGSTSAGAGHTVSAAGTTTAITSDTPDPTVTGEAYTVLFTVTSSGGTPTGNVTVSDGTDQCVGTVAAGSCALTSTTAGSKTLVATYAGDANFGGSASVGVSHTVNAAATTTTITADTPDPSVTGQAYTVSFAVAVSAPGAGTPTGNVTVSDGTDQCVGTVAAGSCALTSTTSGAKSLTATYAGDASFGGSASAGAPHTVNQAATTISITGDSPDPSTVGQAYTVSFSVAVTAPGGGTPTGNVTVSDGTDQCVGTVAAGSCSLTSTTAGTKTLVATYGGDANFSGSASAGVGHTVSTAGSGTTITGATPDPTVVGEAYTVGFTVSGNSPTGNVTVSDGTDQCVGTVAAGSCSLTSTTAGSKTLVATYAGDVNNSGSTSAGVSHTVNPAATTTTITGNSPNPSTVNQAYTVSVAVAANAPGSGTPSSTVTVSDGAASCQVTLASGAGSCQLTSTTGGAKTLVATYAGDANFAGSASAGVSQTVNLISTTTSISGVTPSSSVTGQGYVVSFTVSPTGGTRSDTVVVTDGAATCKATANQGSCTLVSTTAGAKTLVATHLATTTNAASSSAGTAHTVNAAATTTTITADTPDPSSVGQAYTVSFTVAVTSPGAGTPTGNVTVSDGTDQCVGTVAAGGCSLTSTTAGSKSLIATYVGDGNFSTSTSAGAAHTVNPAGTATAITAHTPDPSVTGEPVAVSVTVAGPGGTPTGSVTVSASTGESCPVTLAGGAGSCNLSFPTAGARTITATYGGDANFGGSTSPAVSHTVNAAATTTTITADTPDPSVTGQAYTVSFTVAVTSPGAGTPTGNVTVSDGTDQCVGTVAAGGCSLTSTTAGSKNLVATYAGDGNFDPSPSAGTPHTVSQASTSTVVASSANPSVFGQAVNFTATVTSGAGTPTGSVQFKVDGANFGSPVALNGSGVATSATTTTLTVGSHTVTADYLGDVNFAPSSGTLAGGQTVDPFGAADHLAFGVQPSDVVAGNSISPPVEVRIEDAFGNLVTSATDLVTIVISSDPNSGSGGSTLSGTIPVSASGGIATFNDLSIDLAGNGFTLDASSGSLTPVTSNSFNVQ